MKVKLVDVAREAGVSIATVSRVLNNHPVSEKARSKVEETIARMDYRPNLTARGLSKGESFLIGVVVTNMENPYFSSIMNSMELRFRRDGYMCNFASSVLRGEEEEDILRRFLDSGVDGLVIVEVSRRRENAGLYSELNRHTPVVLINGNPERTDTNLILMDQREGMMKVMDYLISLNHRDIAMVRGDAADFSFDVKEKVYREKLTAAGCEVREERIIRLEDTDHFDTIEETSRRFMDVFASADRPAAVFTSNELMGLGVLDAARKSGLDIPGDISVVAQDNTILSVISTPAMTTIDMNPSGLGHEAAEMMIQLLKTENPSPRRLTFYPELVIRESCR
jgi:DNA-binding LacI/PurR family transcriptional regulator